MEALGNEFMRFSVEKCPLVFREYQSAVGTITGPVSYLTSHLILSNLMLKINVSALEDFFFNGFYGFLVILNSLS